MITWARQYHASTADGNPARDPKVEKLIDWLKNNVPAEDAGGNRSGIVHGDFRLDNLIFHPTEVRLGMGRKATFGLFRSNFEERRFLFWSMKADVKLQAWEMQPCL